MQRKCSNAHPATHQRPPPKRFLPKFKKRNVPRRKPLVVREKKAYTPFPPPQQPSKVDLQLESGEYFLSEAARDARKRAAREDAQREKTEAAKRRREEAFVAPKVRPRAPRMEGRRA